MEKQKVFTTTEAGKILRCTRYTLIHLLERGTLRGYRLGRNWRITQQAIEDFMNRGGDGKQFAERSAA